MKFVGVVSSVVHHSQDERDPKWKKTMDVILSGHVAGNPVTFEVVVAAAEARSYPIGRRVRVTVEPA